MLRIIVVCTCVSLLFSCKEEKIEEVDLKDILPQSENYSGEQVDSISEKETPKKITSTILPKGLGKIHLIINNQIDTFLFLDRFQPDTVEHLLLTKDSSNIEFYAYKWKDSVSVASNLLNWLNCFGEKCQQVEMHEEKRILLTPFLIGVSNEKILFFKSEDKAVIRSIKETLLQNEEDWNTLIYQATKWSKVQWLLEDK